MTHARSNLIWIQVEGNGGGMALPLAGRTPPIDSVPWPAVNLGNMASCWMSTIGSVSGMLTGVSPARLLRTHIPKGQGADLSRFNLPHPPLPQYLAAQGYAVEGFSMFLCFREQLPFFGERGAALAPDMPAYLPRGQVMPGAQPLEQRNGVQYYRYRVGLPGQRTGGPRGAAHARAGGKPAPAQRRTMRAPTATPRPERASACALPF